MMRCSCLVLALAGLAATARGADAGNQSVRAAWDMPARCDPFAEPMIKDLREELRQSGYRLVIAIHPKEPDESKGESINRDLFVINADSTGLKRLTETPDKDERVPRVSPDGRYFSYGYGDYLRDSRTLELSSTPWGGYAWAPDSRRTVHCEKKGIIYTDMFTGENSKPVRVKRNVDIVDMSSDGKWFIFEIRNYLGKEYTIDFMPSAGGGIRKMPSHPVGEGECHPAFSPDGKWMCWNAGESLGIRRFDPALPDGTDGKIVTLPKEVMGQDPCGRWSHCGRYIAYVRISHDGSWEAHSPLHIVRVADGADIMISPDGWLGHHWDYDWLPPEGP